MGASMQRIWVKGVLLFCLGLPVAAQTLGEITGEIRDSTGAVAPGVSVTITNVATNSTRSSLSNDAGVYSFPSLQPGVYNLRAEKQGFKAATAQNIEVQVQQNLRLDLEMTVGSVAETVEVSAVASALTTENSTLGTVIEN